MSTNDYTDTEKTKLSGIEAGAEVNIIETVKVNGTALTPSSKEVNVPVPTKTSDLSNDSGFGTYSKPSGGIPSTDMTSEVQASLGKADTAIQAHQDITGKEDKTNKVTSISSSSTDTQYPSAKCVYDSQAEQNADIEYLGSIISQLPNVSEEGNNFELDNTINAKFIDFKIKGNTEVTSTGLPSEYTEVDGIISTGTQYINTGFNPNQDTKVTMTVKASDRMAIWFGCWNVAYNNGAYAMCNDDRNIYNGYDGQGGGYGSIINSAEHTVEVDKNLVYIDGELFRSFTKTDFQVNYPLYLCCQNRAGTASWGDYGTTAKTFSIVSCKIYDNGNLIRSFVPCYRNSDNVVGLYDLVGDTFYTNQGSGTFSYGSVVSNSANSTFELNSAGANGTITEVIKNSNETQSVSLSIPCQQPMRSINTVRDDFIRQGGTWYERHNISYIESYNGETITTDYISSTGGLDIGATVQYVATTPTLLECTAAQLQAIKNAKASYSYAEKTSISTADETPAYLEVKAFADIEGLINSQIGDAIGGAY